MVFGDSTQRFATRHSTCGAWRGGIFRGIFRKKAVAVSRGENGVNVAAFVCLLRRGTPDFPDTKYNSARNSGGAAGREPCAMVA